MDAVRLPKILAHSLTSSSPHCRHPGYLHAIAAPGNRAIRPALTAVPGKHAISLLLRCWDHAAASSTASNTVAAALGNCAVHSAITITGSTPPDRHHHAQEPCHPPDHHRRRVHAVQPSPPRPGTASSSRPSPSPSPRNPAVTTAQSTPP
jgi:hypothetical protein